jgi:nicotinamide mononucleotide (NMN) deamidase PncC
MSANDSSDAIARIHASGNRLVLSVTGGGSGAISALLAVPGASASVLEAVVPYAATALGRWLGGPVDHYCSERTARAMAMASFQRARILTAAGATVDRRPTGGPTVATEFAVAASLRGIGATASLATTRPKRGPHRIHVAWQSAEVASVASCELTKAARTRGEEERVATALVLEAVAEACGVDAPRLDPPLREPVERRRQRAPAEWTELLLGKRPFLAAGVEPAAEPRILFPGAFNPMHAGHGRMAELAAAQCGGPVTFELSIANVDKPPLDFIEIADRLGQLAGRRVLVTRAATFAEKAAVAPGCVFVVGVDTIARIADPKYYEGDAARRDAAVASIARRGCRFLVFGRATGDRFATLSELDIPISLRALCDEVPETEFRVDISSTELRK